MPNRILREGILRSPGVNKLTMASELFYRRLMSVIDDHGRYEADRGLLRAACFPRQLNSWPESDVQICLDECVKLGLITVYTTNGDTYLQLHNFRQRKRTESRCPDMPGTCPPNDGQVSDLGAVVGAVVGAGAGAGASAAVAAVIPDELNTEAFMVKWSEWVNYRKEIRKAMKPSTIMAQWKKLAKVGPDVAIACIDESISNGWTGLFPEKSDGRNPRGTGQVGKAHHGGSYRSAPPIDA